MKKQLEDSRKEIAALKAAAGQGGCKNPYQNKGGGKVSEETAEATKELVKAASGLPRRLPESTNGSFARSANNGGTHSQNAELQRPGMSSSVPWMQRPCPAASQ